MINIDIILEDNSWDKNHQDICQEVIGKTLEHQQVGGDIELSITLTNNQNIQELNRDYRGKDKPTNVLSFPMDDYQPSTTNHQPTLLGDIILAYQAIEQESKEQGKSFTDHLKHLVAHGVLHLLGYDHIEDDEAAEMEQIEIDILKKLGVENPYE